jgi:aminopeptidase N
MCSQRPIAAWTRCPLGLALLLLSVACGGSAGGSADRGARESVARTAATALRARGEHPEDRSDAREVDALHYALDLQLTPDTHALEGTARITCTARRALTEARFDLVGLSATAARDGDGGALGLRREGDEVVVELGRAHAPGAVFTLELDYGGTPAKGLYFRGEPVDHCFTQGECNDARAWFPCIDHPADRATSELTVRLPPGWSAVSGGERIDVHEDGGGRVERWRMDVPHPTYLTTLVAGELTRVAEVADGLGYEYLAPLRALGDVADVHGAHLAGSLDVTPRVIRFMEELTARPYPYTKYATACVDDFPFGGMENASATTVALTALQSAAGRRDGDAEGLVVHEAAHQWFGDLLTCAEWSEIWLNEGFATYCSLLWIEQRDGREVFDLALSETSERYLAGDERTPRAIVHGVYREPFDLFFSGHVYQGGATRLHLLRDILGDDVFRAGVRRYVGRSQHRAVTTADLQRALEEVAGVDLSAFFADWVHAPGHPVIETSASFDAGRTRVLVRVDQVHAIENGAPAAFRAPITLSLSVGGVVAEHRLEVSQRRHVFEVPAARAPEWVVLDPRGVWPARFRHERSADELAAVIRTHPSGVARREAIRELARRASAAPEERDGPTKAFAAAEAEVDGARSATWLAEHGVPALCAALEADPLAGVRAAAAAALRGACAAPAALAAALRRSGEAPRVRKAACEALAGELVLGGAATDRSSTGENHAHGLAELGGYAQALVDDGSASFTLRGSAARLVLATAPEPGFVRVRATILAARPTVEDPHGALAAALVASLEVLLPDTEAEAVREHRSTAPRRARIALEAVAFATELALDERRSSTEREAAAALLGRALVWSSPARAALAELLGARVVRVRRAAVTALATSEDPAVRRLLEDHYRRTEDPRERHTIEGALGL